MLTYDTIIKGDAATGTVTIGDDVLCPSPSQRVVNHSPDGFSWGYGGSGPAQLALAILLRLIPNEGIAVRLYKEFKRDVIAPMDVGKDFQITVGTVMHWLEKQYLAHTCT